MTAEQLWALWTWRWAWWISKSRWLQCDPWWKWWSRLRYKRLCCKV